MGQTHQGTIVGLFTLRVTADRDKTAIYTKHGGHFRARTWTELQADVRRAAAFLVSISIAHSIIAANSSSVTVGSSALAAHASRATTAPMIGVTSCMTDTSIASVFLNHHTFASIRLAIRNIVNRIDKGIAREVTGDGAALYRQRCQATRCPTKNT